MFEAFIECCIVGVDPYFVSERLRYELDGYHRGRPAIEERLASCVLISVVQCLYGISRHCVVGWLPAKQKRYHGVSWFDVTKNRVEMPEGCAAAVGSISLLHSNGVEKTTRSCKTV